MAAHVIAEVNLSNDSWVQEYGQKVQPILAKHGGKYIVRSAPAGKLEGDHAPRTLSWFSNFRAWRKRRRGMPIPPTRL